MFWLFVEMVSKAVVVSLLLAAVAGTGNVMAAPPTRQLDGAQPTDPTKKVSIRTLLCKSSCVVTVL